MPHHVVVAVSCFWVLLGLGAQSQTLVEDDFESGDLNRAVWCATDDLSTDGVAFDVAYDSISSSYVLHVEALDGIRSRPGALAVLPPFGTSTQLVLEVDVLLLADSVFDLQARKWDRSGSCQTVIFPTTVWAPPNLRYRDGALEIVIYTEPTYPTPGDIEVHTVPGSSLEVGRWYSLKLVSTRNRTKCYVDGTLKLSVDNPVNPFDSNNDWVLFVGDNDSHSGRSCNAYFDNVKWYLEGASGLPAGPEFYDDFAYSSVGEAAGFGWRAVDDESAPPNPTSEYQAVNINFWDNPEGPAGDRLMTLWSIVDAAEIPVNSRLETERKEFLHGTYCARVRFLYEPSGVFPPNENVQTFYAINWYDPEVYPDGHPDYSECDFEYLPWNFWDCEECDDGEPTLWVNTWETIDDTDPITEDERVATPYCRDDGEELEGWYYLLMHVNPGVVSYSIAPDSDGAPGTTTWIASHGGKHVPETHMQIALANWMNEPTDGHTQTVIQEMVIDWVYHMKGQYLTVEQVHSRIGELRALHPSALRYSSMPSYSGPGTFVIDPSGNVYSPATVHARSFQSGLADLAEWVEASGPVEPGDVVELDSHNPGLYRLSTGQCSPYVAGVISTEPAVALGYKVASIRQAPLALTGIVPVKVSDEGGPIRPGDLLVSSSTPGHAMRWAGRGPCPCSLVGKALEPMADETGVILVLLTAH